MLKTFKKGGVHPGDTKLSAGKKLQVLPVPELVCIPVSQHLGKPAKALVKKGDKVKTGQMIAEADGFISANVHSSVSGTVSKVDIAFDASGYKRLSISIVVEGDEWMQEIDRNPGINEVISNTGEEIIQKVLEAGIVGLGGATFPTHVKLTVPKGKKAEYIIINGVECEPYLTSDHALMLEHSEEIVIGVKLLMKALKVEKAIIGIENNKPDAIAALSKAAGSGNGITVQALKIKYPQGGEKQLIKALLNREVPSKGLPVDVGVVVFNVGSTLAVYEAVQKNKPLFERVVTVTGPGLKDPSNFLVRIGTPTNKVIEAAGGLPSNTGKVLSGGPMMGKALNSLDIPIVKGSSGILIMPEAESMRKPVMNCIRCAKCVSVCPMGLEPYLLMTLAELEMNDRMESEHIFDCIECGCCSYTCPSSRPLLDYIRLGKTNVNTIIRTRKNNG